MATRAEADIATTAAARWVVRFTRTERATHWVQAVTFLTLLVTGFVLGFAQFESLVGHRALMREIHLSAAFFFVFGPALIALAGNRRAVGADAHEVDEWSRDEVEWLAHPSLLGDRTTGKFNPGQKLNAVFTAYSTFAFGLTGLIMWQNRRFPYDIVSQANVIHTYLAYLALAVFLGHLYLAVAHPLTRHALHGMIFGTVRRTWAASHHPAWRPALSEPPLSAPALVRSLLLLLIGLEIALLLVRWLFLWLGANVTDPVTNAFYAWSALPVTALPRTGVHVFDLAALVWAGLLGTVWWGLAHRQA